LAVVLLQRLAVGDERRFVVVRARTEVSAQLPSRWSVAVIVLYGLIAVVLPLSALVYVSFSPFWSGVLSFDGLTARYWSEAFDDSSLRDAAWLSVRSAAIATAIVLPIGTAAAWALSGSSRISSFLKSVVDVLCMAPVAVPASLLGFGFLFAFTSGPIILYGKPGLLIVVYVTLMIPHVVRMQLSSLMNLGISSLEASRASGAGPVRTLARIVVPQIRNGLAATIALLFVLLTHEFSASVMVRSVNTRVLGAELYEAYRVGLYPQVAVIALVMVGVTLVGVTAALAVGGSEALRGL
jgi:iron(III) transport system permease protein